MKLYVSFRVGLVGNGVSVSFFKDIVILWFKYDLCLDDYLGVVVVFVYKCVFFVYIFDLYVCVG